MKLIQAERDIYICKALFIMSKHFDHIILRMPNWIGDAVMATPLVKDLRAKFSHAEITLMCQGVVGQLFQNDPNVNEILSFKKTSGWIHGHHADIIAPLRYGGYDLGILATNSLSSAWWFWRGGVETRVGFSSRCRKYLLSVALPFPKERETMHQVDVYKQLLLPVGIPCSSTKMYLHLSDEEKLQAKVFLANYSVKVGTDTIVGINPGAAYGSAKCWLPERFRDLVKKLTEEKGVKVLFFGDRSQQPLIRSITDGFGEDVVNLAGKTSLRQLMALLGSINLLVTNDSGPMHIASALGIPLVALFGSTNPVKTGPYNGGVVLHKKVSCSPCYKRVCPIDFSCMKQISTEEVFAACMKEL